MTTSTSTSNVEYSISTLEEYEARLATSGWLPEEGYHALFLYTEECYWEVNNGLRQGDYPLLAKLMDEELNAMTPTPGKYYRGVSQRAFNLGLFVKDGKTYYQDKGYMSSTSEVNIARNFVLSNSVLLILYGMAYSIEECSSFPEEKEYLWRHHALFEVIKEEVISDSFWEGTKVVPFDVQVYHLRKC